MDRSFPRDLFRDSLSTDGESGAISNTLYLRPIVDPQRASRKHVLVSLFASPTEGLLVCGDLPVEMELIG
jgi:hypothetical protein